MKVGIVGHCLVMVRVAGHFVEVAVVVECWEEEEVDFEEVVVVSYLVGVVESGGVGELGLAWHPLWPAESQPDPLYPQVAGCAPLAVGNQHHSHSSEGPPRTQKVEGESLPSFLEQMP